MVVPGSEPAQPPARPTRAISETSFTLTKHSHQFSFGAKVRRLMEGNIDFTDSCCLTLKVTPQSFISPAWCHSDLGYADITSRCGTALWCQYHTVNPEYLTRLL